MTKPRQWTDTELTNILAKANGLFSTLVGLTESPAEAMEIITMMHLLLYMNYGNGQVSMDIMVDEYVSSFKENFEVQSDANRKVAN